MNTFQNLPEVISDEEWLAARKLLLAKEKELTNARDHVNAERRRCSITSMVGSSWSSKLLCTAQIGNQPASRARQRGMGGRTVSIIIDPHDHHRSFTRP